MKALKDKIQNALDESRILVLAIQIVIGFQFGAVFQEGFQFFPLYSQYLSLLALLFALIGLAFLLWPATYHQIVAVGCDTRPTLDFTNRAIAIALFPLALGLGIDMYICLTRLLGETRSMVFAGALTSLALFF